MGDLKKKEKRTDNEIKVEQDFEQENLCLENDTIDLLRGYITRFAKEQKEQKKEE